MITLSIAKKKTNIFVSFIQFLAWIDMKESWCFWKAQCNRKLAYKFNTLVSEAPNFQNRNAKINVGPSDFLMWLHPWRDYKEAHFLAFLDFFYCPKLDIIFFLHSNIVYLCTWRLAEKCYTSSGKMLHIWWKKMLLLELHQST